MAFHKISISRLTDVSLSAQFNLNANSLYTISIEVSLELVNVKHDKLVICVIQKI